MKKHSKQIVFEAKHYKKLSWKETFKEMFREKEDWTIFEVCLGDGMEGLEPFV